MHRRDFLKTLSTIAAAAALPESGYANSFSDFKVLVVAVTGGGMDSFNAFVPADSATGSKRGYREYVKGRSSSIRIADKDLTSELKSYIDADGDLELTLGSEPFETGGTMSDNYQKGFYLHGGVYGNKIATNSTMPEFAELVLKEKVAFVHNVGNLVEPLTKEQLKSKSKIIPPALTAHNTQSRLAASGQAQYANYKTGWLGRVADAFGDVNSGSIYPLNINLTDIGAARMMLGDNSEAMNYSVDGPVDLYMGKDSNSKDIYKKTLEELMDLGRSDFFEKYLNKARKRGYYELKETLQDWQDIHAADPFGSIKNFYGEDGVFKHPPYKHGQMDKQGRLGYVKSFEAAAYLIKIAKQKGLKRLAIRLHTGGWDQHSGMTTAHASNIRGLSQGVGTLMRAVKAMGLEDSVTICNVSEFGRSLGDNGNGTDHAWGSTYFVVGGAVKGGNYGELPDLTLGGDQDMDTKGRFIPDISFTQNFATLIKWFGATDKQLDAIFPDLKNFNTRDLGFMK